MAGTFTHYMICSKAIHYIHQSEIQNQTRGHGTLGDILGKYRSYVYLGCASPDIPYVGDADWAALLHNDSTNGIVNLGLKQIRSEGGLKDGMAKAKWSWLIGYLSHIVADTIVHPVVNSIVGDYKNNKDRHRICEMIQDAFVFHKEKGLEISYVEYHDDLRPCKDKHYGEIMDMWEALAQQTYTTERHEDLTPPKPKQWTDLYIEAMDTIEGGSGVLALFRNIEVTLSHEYAYRTTKQWRDTHPDWVARYYDNVPMPRRDGFVCFEEVVDYAVISCVEYWTAAYDVMQSQTQNAEIIACIDLDTGMIIGADDDVLTMWEA